MPTDEPVEQEGRTALVAMKITKREERAAGVVAEIRGIGVSTLLHSTPLADVVQEYDRLIGLAKTDWRARLAG